MKKIANIYKEFPPALATEYILRRVASPVGIGIFHYRLLVQEVPDKPLLKNRGQKTIDIRLVGEKEYQHDWFPRPAPVIDDRFRQGAKCWVAFKEDRAVGCQWLIPGAYLEDEVRCQFIPLPEGRAVWDFDIYVVPELRLSRLFLQLWDTSNEWMNAKQIRWTASRVDALNQSSLRAHLRMKAEVVDSVWFLTLGKRLQIARWKGGFHFSFGPDRIPKIAVGPGSA